MLIDISAQLLVDANVRLVEQGQGVRRDMQAGQVRYEIIAHHEAHQDPVIDQLSDIELLLRGRKLVELQF